MEYEQLTEQIIGCAYNVYNKMGFGFLESVYEKCLLIELQKEGLNVESQKPITVLYEGETVGEFIADIVVEDTIILELKPADCKDSRSTVSELLGSHWEAGRSDHQFWGAQSGY